MSAAVEAIATARHDLFVTIGITRSHPTTVFGYIQLGDTLNISDAPNARQVSQFKEKPNARTAAAFLGTGNYLWNDGMFVAKPLLLMDLLQVYKLELLEMIAAKWDDEEGCNEVLDYVWPTLLKIAIDNAVAESAALSGKVAVLAEVDQLRILGDSGLV